MTTLIIDIEKDDIVDISRKLKATYQDAVDAFRFATKTVLESAKEGIANDLSEPLPLEEKGILKRIKLRFDRQGNRAGSFFIGLNPVGLLYATPKPTQTGNGISGGGEFYPSAFFVKTKKGLEIPMERRGKARLPIKKLVVDIEAKAAPFVRDYFDEIQPVFMDTFSKNLVRRMSL